MRLLNHSLRGQDPAPAQREVHSDVLPHAQSLDTPAECYPSCSYSEPPLLSFRVGRLHFVRTGLAQHTVSRPFFPSTTVQVVQMTTAEQFTLLSIGLFTIIVRICIRWRSVGPTNWQIDDYLMPLTGVSRYITSDGHPSDMIAARIVTIANTCSTVAIRCGSCYSLPRWFEVRWPHKQLHDSGAAFEPGRNFGRTLQSCLGFQDPSYRMVILRRHSMGTQSLHYSSVRKIDVSVVESFHKA